jgi:uncharacterized protein
MRLPLLRAALLSAPLVLAAAIVGRAQPPSPRFVKASAAVPKSVAVGKQFTLTVAVSINSHYHIQGNPAAGSNIATELVVGPAKGFKVDKVTYPKAIIKLVAGDKIPVYEGAIQIQADVTADRTVRPGKYTLPVTLRYQGCDDQKCFPPSTVAMKSPMTVSAGGK